MSSARDRAHPFENNIETYDDANRDVLVLETDIRASRLMPTHDDCTCLMPRFMFAEFVRRTPRGDFDRTTRRLLFLAHHREFVVSLQP